LDSYTTLISLFIRGKLYNGTPSKLFKSFFREGFFSLPKKKKEKVSFQTWLASLLEGVWHMV